MEISSGLMNSRLTVETSGRSRRSSRKSSAIDFKLESSVWEDRAIVITPSVGLMARIIGFSVSAGKVVIASIFPLTSFKRLLRSAPLASCTVASQPPSLAVVVSRSIFSVPSRASSIRRQTPVSDSSGVAPKYGTLICRTPSSMSGNSSWLRLK